ncbi:MAG: class II aldolase/adducin family protein, partial [Candidatus Brocadiia bacterium]|nr:class II aldolase/adducin family protein [Candidatus Brocadiia bacterium]
MMADRDERQLRRLFCETGRWMHDRGYAAAAEGSLSARLAENAYLLTPAGCCLGRLQPEQMVTTDAGGAPQRAGRPRHAGL